VIDIVGWLIALAILTALTYWFIRDLQQQAQGKAAPCTNHHRTAVGVVPELGAASWDCTCGASEVINYTPGASDDLAALEAHLKADLHTTNPTRGHRPDREGDHR
jgi:hypothetical protein